MIRYPITLTEIEQKIDAKIPNWRSRAKRRTNAFITKGKYEESSSIWSEVKPVYMAFQHNKCLYCEQQLEGGQLGAIAHDLEHYRPKGNVRAWPTEAERYLFTTGDASDGYYRLAYHLGNYAASCKICNSLLKLDFFPIAASRIADQNDPADYAAELPFLCYPIGTSDEDPEELLTFTISPDGPIAIPKHTETQDADRWRHALIMIDFFDLNRAGLRENRAYSLLAVWEMFKNAECGEVGSGVNLQIFTSPRAPHTNCARRFVELCRKVGQPEVELRYLPILQRIVQNSNA
jgi:hypothetical protein